MKKMKTKHITNLMLVISTLFIMTMLGCVVYRDGFSDEEYIWENWTHSTNTVEVITND